MNEKKPHDDVWELWRRQVAEAEPGEGVADRLVERLLSEAAQAGESQTGESEQAPERVLVRSGWPAWFDRLSEHRVGRLAMCLAALVAGSAPYLYALFVIAFS